MKKNICKLMALVLTLVMVVGLTACGGSDEPSPSTNPPSNDTPAPETPAPEAPAEPAGSDWSSYEGWESENWDSKTVSYQFTGEWSLPENDIYDFFLINLYDDGSVLVDQYSPAGISYQQFGYWSEENTEDGNEISLDTVYCTNNPGEEGLVAHEYHYDLYEEADGGYSFGYTFGIAAGAYFRDADVAGSSTVTYASLNDFHTAMDSAVGGGAAEGGEANEDGEAPDGDGIATYEAGSLTLTLFADGTMRVAMPQYDMSRDGFTYELSEDGTTLTVTGTPGEEEMGAFAQIWAGAGAEVWTIDGTTATPAE